MFTSKNTTMAENVRRDNDVEDRGLQSVSEDYGSMGMHELRNEKPCRWNAKVRVRCELDD